MPYQTISQRPAQQRPQGQSSPGYVSFSRILDANRPGAKRMADTLTQSAEQKGQQASAAMAEANAGFGQKVQQGILQYQAPDTKSLTAPGGGTSSNLYAQAGALQAQAGRGYEGPKDWGAAGYNTAGMASQAAAAQQAAQGLTSMGGRAAQLREGVRGPYGAGMSSLDAALSGAAMGNRGQELASLYGGLSQQLADYQKQAGEAVTAATTASDAAAKQYAEEAQRFQRLGDSAKQSEEEAARYQEEMRRRNEGLRPGAPAPRPITVGGHTFDPRLLTPGLYG